MQDVMTYHIDTINGRHTVEVEYTVHEDSYNYTADYAGYRQTFRDVVVGDIYLTETEYMSETGEDHTRSFTGRKLSKLKQHRLNEIVSFVEGRA